jgi:hypothetical protein
MKDMKGLKKKGFKDYLTDGCSLFSRCSPNVFLF